MENEKNFDEFEVDLRDYLRIIKKRRFGILVIFLVAVIVTGLVNFLMPKTFESSSLIRIGTFQSQSIESPETVIKIFSQEAALADLATVLNLPKTNLKALALQFKLQKSGELLEIKGFGQAPEGAKKMNEAVTTVLLIHHQTIFQKIKEAQQAEIDDLNKKITELTEELVSSEKKIKSQEKTDSEAQARIVASYISSFQSAKERKDGLQRELEAKQKEMLFATQESKIIIPSVLPEKPIKPNKKLNILTAAILGLFIGLFWAFAAEWVSKEKI